MAKKAKQGTSPEKLGLPKGWTLPALAERRRKPRPERETARQRSRAAARRRKG